MLGERGYTAFYFYHKFVTKHPAGPDTNIGF